MKIVVTEFVSLDGVMEDPGGAEGFKHGGWTFRINQGDEVAQSPARIRRKTPR